MLALSIAQNHPFADGNKRTATAAVNLFLSKNRHKISDENQSQLQELIGRLADDDPIKDEDFVKAVAELIEDD